MLLYHRLHFDDSCRAHEGRAALFVGHRDAASSRSEHASSTQTRYDEMRRDVALAGALKRFRDELVYARRRGYHRPHDAPRPIISRLFIATLLGPEAPAQKRPDDDIGRAEPPVSARATLVDFQEAPSAELARPRLSCASDDAAQGVCKDDGATPSADALVFGEAVAD